MARKISICDTSLGRAANVDGSPLPFRVKLEVGKILSRLGVDIIETPSVSEGGKSGYFLVKGLCTTVKDSILSVPVDILDPKSPVSAWEALSCATRSRLKVSVPVSTVQMEYICHRKPAAMLELIGNCIRNCAALCPEVEFVATDFTRSEEEYLNDAISTAIDAGAKIVTLEDSAGDLLPGEFAQKVESVRRMLPEDVRLGVCCSNNLFMADACAVEAVLKGVDEIKTVAWGNSTASLKRFPHIVDSKTAVLSASCGISLTGLDHAIDKIKQLCDVTRSKSPTAVAIPADVQSEVKLVSGDSRETVLAAAARLGYELSDDDADRVFKAFQDLSGSKSEMGAREIDAIVASVAFQVPATYQLESFVINTGNILTPTCQIRIRKNGKVLENVSTGDGPVDAAFLAIEKVLGHHYELDDFQIKSVTEGREAMGETIVRLRHEGKVYSGRGLSKDIVGSSVLAYLSALNKISYEEEEA